MKIVKIIFFCLLTITLISNCGYKPIYSTSNLDLKLNKINFESNKINNQIVRSLQLFSNPDGSKSYDINIETKKEKRIVSKNSKGDTELYELKINLKMIVETKTRKITKNFENKIKYNNNDNKFELKQYESEIEKQIISDLIEQIIIFFYEI
jgi:outer membrane lipopolysaccharide assembly protein LptE/RlpB